MNMTCLRLAMILIAVIFGGLAACSPNVAFKDFLRPKTGPVQFGCAMAPDRPQATVRGKIVFGTISDHRAHPLIAGQVLSGWSDGRIDLAFDPQTEPLDVLEEDLRRVLTANGLKFTAGSQVSEGGIRLDGNLIAAHSELTEGWSQSEVIGQFVFTLGLVRQKDEEILWTARFAGKYDLEPVHISSRGVSEAVNGAYCEALGKFMGIAESESFRNALRDH